MGWGNLRVINEDRIEPGRGFGEHSHRDMDIISYVLTGELAHRDSLGNIEGIPPGDVQRMVRLLEFCTANLTTLRAIKLILFRFGLNPK